MIIKNTERNLELVKALAEETVGTRWSFKYGVRKDGPYIGVDMERNDRERFTPAVYVDDFMFEGSLNFTVQTTSYGAMPTAEIMDIANRLMEAATLVSKLTNIVEAYGIDKMEG